MGSEWCNKGFKSPKAIWTGRVKTLKLPETIHFKNNTQVQNFGYAFFHFLTLKSKVHIKVEGSHYSKVHIKVEGRKSKGNSKLVGSRMLRFTLGIRHPTSDFRLIRL